MSERNQTELNAIIQEVLAEKGFASLDGLSNIEKWDIETTAKHRYDYRHDERTVELEAVKKELELLRAQNAALQSAKSQPVQSGKASFDSASVRARIGASWYGLGTDAKLRAAGVDPNTVNVKEVSKLFGRGANTAAALDLSRNSPQRYAQLREVARLLDADGR